LFLLATALIVPPVAIALIVWAASGLLQRSSPNAARTAPQALTLGPALLLGQGIVPVALAIFSLVVQPAMQPRYSIAAALLAAPVVALSWSRSTNVFRALMAGSIMASTVMLVRDAGRGARERARVVREDIEQVSRIVALDSSVVVRRRHSLYPILLAKPGFADRAVLFDAASIAPNDKFAVVERDVARVHQRQYGFPRIVTREDLDSARAFYFLELDSRRSPTPAEFPRRRIQRVAPRLFRVERACEERQPATEPHSSQEGC
jgi:hypothetical protein